MILREGANNRFLVYLFYDRDGIVDNYIIYMLRKMRECVGRIMVVCNGMLSEGQKEKLSEVADEIYERENVGFDVWAYKSSLERIGWDQLCNYDEVIFMNYTIMGPIYPLKDMFDDMDVRDLDYWGATKGHSLPYDPIGNIPFGYLPDHIQTHFLAVRRSLFDTEVFHQYWESMPMIKGYTESVGKHEAYFTKYFADMGYKWDVYADSEEYRELTHQPVQVMATEMIRDKKLPFFKRRSFMQDYRVVINETFGHMGRMLMDYITDETAYDENLIWDNILRLENMADIKQNLRLNFVLPSDSFLNKKSGRCHDRKNLALIIHIYYLDLIKECLHYAGSMPDYADIYITTDCETKKKKIEEIFSVLPNKVDVRVCPNRGRDIGAFLVESGMYIFEYDYICHIHDKNVEQVGPGSIGVGALDKCLQNVLATKCFVENVIETFEKNPRMGILMPPPPNHGSYYLNLGLEWGENFQVTKRLAEQLGISVNISADKELIAPLESIFWVRSDALRPLFARTWKYEDFPEEPLKNGGTVLHGIKCLYGFAAQACGYYAGWLFSEHCAEQEMTNMYFMLRGLNTKIFNEWKINGSYDIVMSQLDERVKVSKAKTESIFLKSCRGYAYLKNNGLKAFVGRVMKRKKTKD